MARMRKSKKSDDAKAKSKQAEDRRKAYASMASAGISSLAGDTTDDARGRDARERQREYSKKTGAVLPKSTIIREEKDKQKEEKDIETYEKYLDEDYGEDTLLNKIFGNRINRLTPKQMERVKKILAEYKKLGVKNPVQLRSLMFSNIGGGLLGKDQTFSDMEGNIIKQKDIIFQDGKMFFKDEDGELQPVRRTKEGTIDFLKEQGSDIMKSLKKFNPELYYPFMGMPGTSGGIADLGKEQTIDLSQLGRGTKEYEDAVKYNNMIYQAREISSRDRDDRRANRGIGGSGSGGGGGGGGDPTYPTDPTNPNIPTPDYYLRRQYMPQNVTGFTPDYTGGPEQMQIAGGWWDPTGKKWLGSPWGTQNQYQFNQGGIVGTNPLLFKNQGGMASDKGIKSFKKYGY